MPECLSDQGQGIAVLQSSHHQIPSPRLDSPRGMTQAGASKSIGNNLTSRKRWAFSQREVHPTGKSKPISHARSCHQPTTHTQHMDGADNKINATMLFAHCAALVRQPPTSLGHVRLTEDQKLKLYALFKQATEGDNATTCPSLLDIVGRAKWNAWQAMAGISHADAQARYVACIQEWYGDGAASGMKDTAQRDGAGRNLGRKDDDNFSFGSSQLRALGEIGIDGCIVRRERRKGEERGKEGEEEEEGEEAQDVFYYVKRGMVEEVLARLEKGEREGEPRVDIDVRDEEGRTLLHWAVDRNHRVLVELLLTRGSDRTAEDAEGETPLDYARLCEHDALVEILVNLEKAPGARKSVGLESTQEASKGKERAAKG